MDNFIIEGTTLVSYKGKEKNITIPDEIRKIGKGAFKNCKMESVSFSDKSSLAKIEDSAFENCTKLESIKLPKGLSEIGDDVFFGCDNLNYIFIPYTVAFIGKDILTNTNATIISTYGSTAEKYAKDNGFTFDPNLSVIEDRLNKKNELKKRLKKKNFTVFDEKITCSNSYPIYREILNYFNDEYKNKLYKEIYDALPKGIDDNSKKNPIEILIDLIKKEVTRLSEYGLIINDDMVSQKIQATFAIKAIIVAYYEYRKEIAERGTSEYKDEVMDLYKKAENNATGLSYGMIGSASDMILYDLDNLLATRKQLKNNFNEAKRQSDILLGQKKKEIDNKIYEGLKLVDPKIKEATSVLVDELKDFELNKLSDAGIIDLKTNKNADLKKAEHYYALMSKGQDIKYNASQVLNNDPADVRVYDYCLSHDMGNSQLLELAEFMNLDNHYKKTVKNNILTKTNIKEMVDSAINNKYCFSKNEYTDIVNKIGKREEAKIDEVAKNYIDPSKDADSYFRQQLDSFFTGTVQKFLADNKARSDFYGPDWDTDTVLKRMADLRKIEIGKEDSYNEALTLLANQNGKEDYLKAIELLTSISDYKDSEKRKSAARFLIEQDEKYLQLIDSIDKADCKDDYIRIQEELKELGGYRESKDLIDKCQIELDAIIEKEKEEREEKKQKIKKTAGIVAIIALIVALFLMLTVKVIIPNSKYNSAIKLMESGNYEEAISAFQQMEGYKDSEDKIKECQEAIADLKYGDDYNKAVSLMSSGKYEEAIGIFEKLNGYKDSKTKISECQNAIADLKYGDDYNKALSYMDSGNYKEALDILKNIDVSYKDTKNKIIECNDAIFGDDYNKAISLMNSENYEEAVGIFEKLNGYKDSEDKIKVCNDKIADLKYGDDYNNALSLKASNKYEEALKLFESMGDYKDAKSQAEACKKEIESTCYGRIKGFEEYLNNEFPDDNYTIKQDRYDFIIYKNGKSTGRYISFYKDVEGSILGSCLDEGDERLNTSPDEVYFNTHVTRENAKDDRFIGAFIYYFDASKNIDAGVRLLNEVLIRPQENTWAGSYHFYETSKIGALGEISFSDDSYDTDILGNPLIIWIDYVKED